MHATIVYFSFQKYYYIGYSRYSNKRYSNKLKFIIFLYKFFTLEMQTEYDLKNFIISLYY